MSQAAKSKISNKSITAIDLPDLVQSMAQSGRSGQLLVSSDGKRCAVHFRNGAIAALDNGEPAALHNALSWIRLIDRAMLKQHGIDKPKSLANEFLGPLLVDSGLVPLDGVRDAVDIHIEEGFCEVVGWDNPVFEFDGEIEPDPWCAYQINLGTSVAPGGLLMEGLRRKDELGRVRVYVPLTWDVLIKEADPDPSELDEGQKAIMQAWADGRPAGAVMEISRQPPWAAEVSCARLIESGVLRLAEGAELVVFADRARSSGSYTMAEGLYRRALERGAMASRIYLALAELSERRGDETRAARDYLRAAEDLATANPAEAVIALRNALRLGADRETCLQNLLNIYRQLGEADDVIDVLFQLADLYESSDRIAEAMDVVREAQAAGADMVRCSQMLAALSLLSDDQDEAVVHLEQVLRTAEEHGRAEEAFAARRQMLLIDPGRWEIAISHVNVLIAKGNEEQALRVLERALSAERKVGGEALEVKLREMLAKLDSNDRDNHEALAALYQKREDRAGATSHLEHLANSQERDGDHHGLIQTLKQIIALGGDSGSSYARLAAVEHLVGLEGDSADNWVHALDTALESGDVNSARAWSQAGMKDHPGSAPIRERAAVVAVREADSQRAERLYRDAARLARGSGNAEYAHHLLQQAMVLAPEDMSLRLELVEMAEQSGEADHVIGDFIRFAVNSNNIGIALEWSARRIARVERPSIHARSEHVELLRRVGRHQEELTQGRELFSDLCEAGEYDSALEVLQRLVASHSRNADLVLQLAELFEALENVEEAVRFYRHAVSLFQQDDQSVQSRTALESLANLLPGDPEVARARELLDNGEAVNWAAIRQERTAASKRRIGEGVVMGGNNPAERRMRVGTDRLHI